MLGVDKVGNESDWTNAGGASGDEEEEEEDEVAAMFLWFDRWDVPSVYKPLFCTVVSRDEEDEEGHEKDNNEQIKIL
ncbi:hypothetical protein LOK49_LG02G02555 [Camellia lanceoleosa]|uniref:Uncharacterized protein n=1 Tax=Camellia lanceoleosa TaxID=1840588 RepID=A0ACC0IJ33_9ERIC|nr:hypothetical protein LOK49_LG02G02555 [Camellia lanceoleosa]